MNCNIVSDAPFNQIVDAVILKTNDYLHDELSYDNHVHFSELSVSDSDLISESDITIVFSSDISVYSYILDSPHIFEKQGIGIYSCDCYLFVFIGKIYEKLTTDQISYANIISKISKVSSSSISTFDDCAEKISDYVSFRIAHFFLYSCSF